MNLQELGEKERVGEGQEPELEGGERDTDQDERRGGEGEWSQRDEERDKGDDHAGGGEVGGEEGEGAVLRGDVQLQRHLGLLLPHTGEAKAIVRHEPSKPEDWPWQSLYGQTKGNVGRKGCILRCQENNSRWSRSLR